MTVIMFIALVAFCTVGASHAGGGAVRRRRPVARVQRTVQRTVVMTPAEERHFAILVAQERRRIHEAVEAELAMLRAERRW
jgi:hypothetical protein